ncbi:MAG: hypothetical protein Q7V20_23665 [Aquabacterium sp.]|uniref:hypothetical protein n=1 Tax=Aquabacterium sp. TaxID=1872578 RepID=UPI0027263273|nr:hypothetical protein [Aquabacterium sp.]MDO9006452.1 hypothetical protein [Aquabacterium sp.]
MARDSSITLTHLYGIAGVVAGAISIYYLISPESTWREYALVASGWLAAFSFAVLLTKAHAEARSDSQQIGQLTKQVEHLQQNLERQIQGLQAELERRSATSDYLAGLLTGRSATPRAAIREKPGEDPIHD